MLPYRWFPTKSRSHAAPRSRASALLAGCALTLGCNQVLGLDGLRIAEGSDAGPRDASVEPDTLDGSAFGNDADLDADAGCTSHRQCSEELTRNLESDDLVSAVCRKSDGQCVPLLSEDCTTITGDALDDQAILLGSLFSITGSQAATNLVRQRSAALAVEQINEVGGIPKPDARSGGRPLVMVSCDEAADPRRAAEHLVTTLEVAAIVGPNTSQDTIDLTNTLTAAAGTVLMTPTGVASSIADLRDDDFTWAMAPSDVQRAPLMIQQIGVLEQSVLSERSVATVKLAVVYREDALGVGTRASLNTLTLNGAGIAAPENLNVNVSLDGYDPRATEQTAIVDEYLRFRPDIIVMGGLAEAITRVMVPLEAGWGEGPRPHYVLIDSLKVPELLDAASADPSLRSRVRGSGITPGAESKPFYDAFYVDYDQRYPGTITTLISGMGPAYDATYAIAFALAATRDRQPSGAEVVRGLRTFNAPNALAIGVTRTRILEAFQHITAGDSIAPIGTFAPLVWDQNGAVSGGTLEMWCIAQAAGKAVYRTSGFTYDLATSSFAGAYTPCTAAP